jgi:hypothetical protein
MGAWIIPPDPGSQFFGAPSPVEILPIPGYQHFHENSERCKFLVAGSHIAAF